MTAPTRGPRKEGGSIRELPSGRWNVRYTANGQRYNGQTFDTRDEAERWLAGRAPRKRGPYVPKNLPQQVYFGRYRDLIKIGVSACPEARCISLGLDLARKIDGGPQLEKALHRVFRASNVVLRHDGRWQTEFFHAGPVDAYLATGILPDPYAHLALEDDPDPLGTVYRQDAWTP